MKKNNYFALDNVSQRHLLEQAIVKVGLLYWMIFG